MTAPKARVEAINSPPFHIRISDVFGDRTGGDHVAIKVGWYHMWLLLIAVQSMDLITRIVRWFT